MISIKMFTFNAFAENTYVLYDESKECVIIDPGCSHAAEEEELTAFISANGLQPVKLLNTHCHIDHILGNKYVTERYGLQLYAHRLETIVLKQADEMAYMFNMPSPNSPPISHYINEGDEITFGQSSLKVFFTPGHAPGHVVFYIEEQGIVIGGDVLFRESIGRTDLPGGSLEVLLQSIQNKLLPLGDETVVYPGHGPHTTIGYEKNYNYYLQDLKV